MPNPVHGSSCCDGHELVTNMNKNDDGVETTTSEEVVLARKTEWTRRKKCRLGSHLDYIIRLGWLVS